jgi:hypothetical protein
MKSIFFLDSNDPRKSRYDSTHSSFHTTRDNPSTHPEAFQPHFHEFLIYTGPDSDDLLEEDAVTEKNDSDIILKLFAVANTELFYTSYKSYNRLLNHSYGNSFHDGSIIFLYHLTTH